MTDQRPASSVNLFRPSASSLTPASNEFGVTDIDSAPSGAFSQELSRASYRAASSSEPARWRQDSSSDAAQRSSSRSSESSQGTDSAASSQRSDKRFETSSDQSRASANPADGAGNGSARTASRKPPSQTDSPDGSKAPADKLVKHAETNAADRADASEVHTNSPDGMQVLRSDNGNNGSVSVEQNVHGAVDSQDEKGLLSGDENQIAGMSVPVKTEPVLSRQVNGELASGLSASRLPVVPGNGTRTTVQSGGSEMAESSNDSNITSNPGRALADRLVMGEHLSPSELENRQAAMVNTQGNRDRQGVGTVTLDNVTQQAAHEAPLLRPFGVVKATGTGPGGLAQPDLPMLEESLDSQGLPPVEKEGLQNARQAAQSVLQLQANTQEAMQVRKIEQQSTTASVLQSKQLAQQQAQSGVLSVVAADNSSQTPDNMFLSLPGGIVTAPVLQRADAVNAQAMSAPVNMPILQSDADKAMASNIRWMVSEGVKSAVVNVTPSGMGPISVSIGVENDQMNVSIVALQGSTREALDSMLPRLREQLAAQGHDSVKVDISDGRPEQSDRGYRQMYSDGQGNAESSSNSDGRQSDTSGSGNNGADDEHLVSLHEQGVLTVNNNGQIKSSYDVYV